MNSDKLYSKCPRVGLVSLGCSKNAVDSEILLGELKSRGFDIVNDAAQAEVIIVNTCGFIGFSIWRNIKPQAAANCLLSRVV